MNQRIFFLYLKETFTDHQVQNTMKIGKKI